MNPGSELSPRASGPQNRPLVRAPSEAPFHRSAGTVADDPVAVKAVHRRFFDAGADVAITVSYQATLQGYRDVSMLGVTCRDVFSHRSFSLHTL